MTAVYHKLLFMEHINMKCMRNTHPFLYSGGIPWQQKPHLTILICVTLADSHGLKIIPTRFHEILFSSYLSFDNNYIIKEL